MANTSFDSIKAQLHPYILSILSDICPGGRLRGHEYEAGSVYGGAGDSFKFNILKDTWADFAVQGHEGHGIVDLYMLIKNLSFKDAISNLQEMYLSKPTESVKAPQERPKPQKKESFPIRPPDNVIAPNFTHYQLGEPNSVYEYKDVDNKLLYYVVRYSFINKKGEPDKELRPLSYCDDQQWRWKAWKENRPLYGLELLKKFPDKKILIVEGEKAADAARSFINAYNVLTWQGGVKAIDKTDWSSLKDKEVLLWPDADEPGLIAMREISELLMDKAKTIKVIRPDRESGWDAADALQEGWDYKRFIEWAKDNHAVSKDPDNRQIVEANEKRIAILSIRANYPMVDGKLNPLNTVENFEHILNSYGIIIRNNLLTKREEILIPNEFFHDEGKENAQLARIKSLCAQHSFSIGQVEEYMKLVANKNQYNPVVTWIKSKPWDGVNRLNSFFNTVVANGEATNEKVKWIKETIIKRWMISAVAAVFRPDGVSAHGVLVFQGLQGLGKTYWFKKLVPKDTKFAKDGVTLKTDDKDSVMQALSFWLVELGEVDATFRKSDISQLKSFITKDNDTYRMPFARREATYARRTVFFASVNPQFFLHDDENRRFWTIACDSVNYNHDFDMQQVWAEVYENHYLKGDTFYLTKEEKEYLDGHNEDFKSTDPIEELIQERLDWEYLPHTWEDKTATEVLIDCGVKNPNKAQLNTASNLIKKLNGNRVSKTRLGRLLKVPPLKAKYEEN